MASWCGAGPRTTDALPRLRWRGQRDRDARAQGRFQRAVGVFARPTSRFHLGVAPRGTTVRLSNGHSLSRPGIEVVTACALATTATFGVFSELQVADFDSFLRFFLFHFILLSRWFGLRLKTRKHWACLRGRIAHKIRRVRFIISTEARADACVTLARSFSSDDLDDDCCTGVFRLGKKNRQGSRSTGKFCSGFFDSVKISVIQNGVVATARTKKGNWRRWGRAFPETAERQKHMALLSAKVDLALRLHVVKQSLCALWI